MRFGTWSKTEADYSRKVVSSGLEGARCAAEEFLNGQHFSELLADSLHSAFRGAALGAYIGTLASYSATRRNSLGRALALGMLGGVIGFGASIIWENRRLTAYAAHGASKNISRVRDEHWMQKHSIAYA